MPGHGRIEVSRIALIRRQLPAMSTGSDEPTKKNVGDPLDPDPYWLTCKSRPLPQFRGLRRFPRPFAEFHRSLQFRRPRNPRMSSGYASFGVCGNATVGGVLWNSADFAASGDITVLVSGARRVRASSVHGISLISKTRSGGAGILRIAPLGYSGAGCGWVARSPVGSKKTKWDLVKNDGRA